jgi:hypothetical protein
MDVKFNSNEEMVTTEEEIMEVSEEEIMETGTSAANYPVEKKGINKKRLEVQ